MLSRTFAYRRLYVDAVYERAPHRALLAVWAEILRLSFVFVACVLFATIFWALGFGAYARDGLLSLWTVAAFACALASSAGALAAAAGVLSALRDKGRVRTALDERLPR